MTKLVLHLAIGLWFTSAMARTPLQPDPFQVGVYGDGARTVTCVNGAAGASFEQVIWAWVPDDLGLAYITLRFAFPANLDLSAAPDFHASVYEVVITEYVGGTVEWNMLFTGCASGWVEVFSQECVLLDDQPSRIGILASASMLRDCTFVLNDVQVLNELIINEPGCDTVIDMPTSWSGIKLRYRP